MIIHGLKIHHCKAQTASTVLGPDKKIVNVGPVDGDAIRMLTSSKIWIDHNTLFDCEDGLIDVTRGSTDITISNNWFRTQNKVMLLGHDDGFLRDKNLKVTILLHSVILVLIATRECQGTRSTNEIIVTFKLNFKIF